MDEYASILIEGKKTVRPSSDDRDRQSGLAREPENLRKEHRVIRRHDIVEVSSRCSSLKCGKERYVYIFSQEMRFLHRDMIVRRERNAREKKKLTD